MPLACGWMPVSTAPSPMLLSGTGPSVQDERECLLFSDTVNGFRRLPDNHANLIVDTLQSRWRR